MPENAVATVPKTPAPIAGSTGSRNVRWTLRAVAAAVGVAAVWLGARQFLNDNRLSEIAYHADEGIHLSCSDFYDLYFHQRDWHHPRWFHELYGPDQPHLGHYLIGWHLDRHGVKRPPCERYEYPLSFEENRGVGAVPAAETVFVARRLMGWLALGTLVLYVLIGFAIGRPLTGAIAACLLTSNTLYVVSCSRAMLEAPLVFACGCAILFSVVGLRLLGRPRSIRTWITILMGIVAGAIIGSAACIKLMGGATGLLWALSMSLLWLTPELRKPGRRSRPLLITALAALVAAVLFYGSNPYLCSYPGENTQARHGLFRGLDNMFTHAKAREAAQHWGFPDAAVFDSWQRFKLTARRTLMKKTPRESVRKIGLNLSRLDSDPVPEKVIYQARGDYATIGAIAGVPVDLVLAILGCAVLVTQIIRRYRDSRRIDSSVVILLWVGITFAATWYWLPLDWDRYYLLPVTAVQFVMAVALAWPLERLMRPRPNTA